MNRLTPFATMIASGVLSILLVGAAIAFSLNQPWLGLSPIIEAATGQIVTGDGDRLLTVGGIAIDAEDLIEEPDHIATYSAQSRFLARQAELFDVLLQAEIATVVAPSTGGQRVVTVRPSSHRPIGSMPLAFWLQLAIGVVSMLIGSWVWSFRRTDLSAILVQTIGLGMLIMTSTAAVYSARELALEGAVFRSLAALDHFGAFLIGTSSVILFLSYPARIVRPWVLYMVGMVGIAYWLADSNAVFFKGPPTGFYLPFLVMFVIFAVSTTVQFRRARGQPTARAALRWITLSFVIGTGSFVVAAVIPNFIGVRPLIPQAYSFVCLIAIFIGIAIGVARHNLFAIEDWAFTVLFYAGGICILLMLDALLISAVALDQGPAFGVSLLFVGLLYLPARDWLARRLMPRQLGLDRDAMFAELVDVALTDDREAQRTRWYAVLRLAFDPMTIEPIDDFKGGHARVGEAGLRLEVPSVPPLLATKLTYAFQARRLFTPRDERRAEELCTMLSHLTERRDAREQGAAEERSRIMRDMHDNLGAQLLSALRSPSPSRKNAIIGDALGDLRRLIGEDQSRPRSFEEALAEIRIEAAERLVDAGIALDWNSGSIRRAAPSPQLFHELRSVIREAVSNTIKHAKATEMHVHFTDDNGQIGIEIVDDGRGASPSREIAGSGLANMSVRLRGLSGSLSYTGEKGFRLTASLPVARVP